MKWWRGEKCNSSISDQEIEILQTYEAEEERGLMHTPIWQQRMAQLEVLRDEQQREEPAE